MQKLISFKQSNLFLQRILIQNLCLTKISNMILTNFKHVTILYSLKTKKKTEKKGNRTETLAENKLLLYWNEVTTMMTLSKIKKILPVYGSSNIF